MKAFVWLYVVFLCLMPAICKAQAYDGEFDAKFFVGYEHINGYSGFEIQFDDGAGDVISLGTKLQVLFGVDPITVCGSDEVKNSIRAIDFGVFVRAHFSIPANLPEHVDPYVGFDIGLKSLGPHIGCKYSFSEVLGLYMQYSRSLSGSYYSTAFSEDGPENNVFGSHGALSFGLTVNL